jgi:mRNA interferase RelE/StbE
MPANVAARVRVKIRQYADDPASLASNVAKLQGRDGYRLRVGDYRVIFAIAGNTMQVLDIGSRGSIYD